MSSNRKDSRETRRKLIRAAERLFAAHSIDDVSLADINRAAGARNRNALHYHFGNKETLLDAVLDKHSLEIDQARRQMLDELDRDAEYSLKNLIHVLVQPVASKLDDTDGGVDFIKINAQLMAIEHYASVRRARIEKLPQARRLQKLIQKQMPTLSSKIIQARIIIIDCILFQGLASYLSIKPHISHRLFINTLIDSIVATLTASDQ